MTMSKGAPPGTRSLVIWFSRYAALSGSVAFHWPALRPNKGERLPDPGRPNSRSLVSAKCQLGP